MSKITVLYPFDNNYAPYAGISLTSLLENNQDAESIHVYLLGFDLSEETVAKFRTTVSKYDRKITLIDQKPVDDLIRTLNMPAYRGARVAIARLFVSLYMPQDVRRLLYLDSDTIITGRVTELVNADLGENPVGMVCDSVARDYKKLMGFTPEEDYYNGGMIVYDLFKWRELQCTEHIIEHIKTMRNNYEALDQDLINIVLKGKIQRLDLKFNFQPFHLIYSPSTYLKVYGEKGYYNEGEIRSASENTAILHTFRYLGMFPWHKKSIHPCVHDYEIYKHISEWSNLKHDDQYRKDFTLESERILQKILPKSWFLCIFRLVFLLQMKRIEKRLRKNRAYTNV